MVSEKKHDRKAQQQEPSERHRIHGLLFVNLPATPAKGAVNFGLLILTKESHLALIVSSSSHFAESRVRISSPLGPVHPSPPVQPPRDLGKIKGEPGRDEA